MSKLRVYKVAEQLGMDNKALVALFQSLGVDEVRNHMSTVSVDQVERAKRHLSRGDDDKMVEERVRGGGGAGVIIRRKKAADADEPVVEAAPPVRRAGRPDATAPVARPAPVSSPVAASSPVVSQPPVASPAPMAAGTSQQPAAGSPTAGSPAAGSPAAGSPAAGSPVAVSPAESRAAASPPAGFVAAEPSLASPAPASPPAVASAVAQPSTGVSAASSAAVAQPAAPVATPPAVAETPIADQPAKPADAIAPAPVAQKPARGAPEPSMTAEPVIALREPETLANLSAPDVRVEAPKAPAKTQGAAAEPAAAGPDRGAPQPEKGAAKPVAPVAAKPDPKAATAAPRPGAAVRAAAGPRTADEPRAAEPIRRVTAPLGPAAAAAARAAERTRDSGSQGYAGSAYSSTQSSPPSQTSGERKVGTGTADDRSNVRTRPAVTDVPRPAPKTGIDVWEGRPGVPMPQAPRNSGVPRRVQYDAKGGAAAASQGARRGPPGSLGNNSRGRPGQSGPGRRGVGQLQSRRPGSGAIGTQERAAHKKVVRIEGDISLQTLGAKMGVKAGEVLMKLMSLGVSGININSTLDSDTAKIVGEEFGWAVEDVAVSEDAAIAAAQGGEAEAVDEEREPRPPVVTVMGHVDHGKTSLLDRIRKATVAQGEAGGITQHIGAYSVKTKKGRVTFLDTPGHAAFTQMRARGAKVTDVVVLVVAADDGVMPQTREAVSHAKDAKCPIVVAVNKIDKPDAQPERVRRELSEVGLVPEEWGGDTLFCEVSAHSGQGIDELLDAILLQAELLDLRANPKRHARGTVIEAKLDRGQGPVATVLVTEGTLRKGDGVLVGNSWGKVRAMLDEHGRNLPSAGPSTPVAIIGLSEVPSAGDIVDAVSDARKAQQIAEQRRDKLAEKSRGSTSKVSLEELARRMSQSDQKELKLIIKGDVQGSVEALSDALSKLSTDKVRVTVVHSAVGAVTEGDVNLGVAAKAIIISFNARPAGKASTLAQKEGIEIRQYSVIYDAIDDVLATMHGLLAPKLVEEAIGEAEVRKIFKVSKAGVVAGCMVTNGVIRRNSFVRLRRGKDIVWEGKLDSLKRFKDDAKEVREGFDCGISFNGFAELQEGDIVAAFEMKEVRATL